MTALRMSTPSVISMVCPATVCMRMSPPTLMWCSPPGSSMRVAKQTPNLPEGATLSFWRDAAVPFKGRVETLLKNGLGGLPLVFLVLVLFLRPAVAVWVSVGTPLPSWVHSAP